MEICPGLNSVIKITKKYRKIRKACRTFILKIKRQQNYKLNYENCEKTNEISANGCVAALNKTKIAKITRIAEFRKVVDANRRRNANGIRGRPSGKVRNLRKLGESRKIVSFAEEFNMVGHKCGHEKYKSKICKGPRTIMLLKVYVESAKDLISQKMKSICADILCGHLLEFCYTVLTRPNQVETAVHGCNPTLSVSVMFVSRT